MDLMKSSPFELERWWHGSQKEPVLLWKYSERTGVQSMGNDSSAVIYLGQTTFRVEYSVLGVSYEEWRAVDQLEYCGSGRERQTSWWRFVEYALHKLVEEGYLAHTREHLGENVTAVFKFVKTWYMEKWLDLK